MSIPFNPTEAQQLAWMATAVLDDQVFDPYNQKVRRPIDQVVGFVFYAIKEAYLEGCQDYLINHHPTGPIAKIFLPKTLGIGDWHVCARNLQGYLQNEYSYAFAGQLFRVDDFEKHRTVIEELWGCRVSIRRMWDNPCGVTIRPAPPLLTVHIPEKISLGLIVSNQIVLGTDIFTGQVIADHVRNLPHMLIVGTSGFGKSVFLNQIITQLLVADRAEVARVLLVDLKGGIEFHGYARRSDRVRVVWEFEEVVEVVEELIELMFDRQREMVANSWRLYPGRRVFFIVDEFAQIQLYPTETKDEKATHARLIANLNRLSMLGRAVGIVLIAAIQKPTTDVMDSSFRMNLQGQVCFRVPNRLLASTMFGSVDELKVDPVTLPRGRFIYYDPIAGMTRYLQAHVAPD